MLGFSLQKLLVLASIVAAVWYGFRWVSRLQEARKLDQEARAADLKDSRGTRRPAKQAAAEDMARCPTCDAFVPARGATPCDRSDCPQ